MVTASDSATAIIFAGSDRTGMIGTRPVAAHELCGKPMIHFVIDSALRWGARAALVIVDEGDAEFATTLMSAYGARVECFSGSGGRRGEAIRGFNSTHGSLLTFALRGNTPQLTAFDLSQLAAIMGPATDLGILERGSSPEAAACAIRSTLFAKMLVDPHRGNGELDIDKLLSKPGSEVGVVRLRAATTDLCIINDRVDLALAENALYQRIADDLRRSGVTIRGRARIDAGVVVEPEAIIEDGVSLRGKTRVASGARIDIGSVLTDVIVASGAIVKPHSVCTGASIREAAEVGPLSHIRPGSDIGVNARIGNFVETKNVVLHRGAMANHLAYLGDGDVGEGANIGAGTIFCNSDGINKHRTEVGARAFVGSDCQLVAPVRIGVGAFVATGTTVTRDVPDDALAIARVPQQNKEGYATTLRARFAAIAAKAKARLG